MSGQNPPKVSACSSRRSSQNGAHPPPDSKNTTTQPGVALEDAEGDELGAGQHLLEGVGDGVQDERVEGPVGPEGGHDDRAALVDPDGHVQLLGGRPQRLVGGVRQRAPPAGVGSDEGGREAELVVARLQLGPAAASGSCTGTMAAPNSRRDRRRSTRPASRCRPGRAATAAGRSVEGPEVQADRREEHGLVDALGVHVGEPGHGVRATGQRLLQGAEAGRVGEAGSGRGQGARAARPGSRCRPPPRARSRARRASIRGRCSSGTSAHAAGVRPRGRRRPPHGGRRPAGSVDRPGPSGAEPRAVTESRRRPSSRPASRRLRAAGGGTGVAALPAAIIRSSSSGRVPKVRGQHGLGCRARWSRRGGSRSPP